MGAELLIEARVSLRYGAQAVLRDLEMTIAPGATVGLAGESGSGKSSLGQILLGLLRAPAVVEGSVRFRGEELVGRGEREWRRIRGRRIALIPQLPQTALNPALTLGEHVRLFWKTHSERPWGEGLARMQGLLAGCNLPGDTGFLGRYPRQISVGQAQRFVIALAVLHAPDLVIGDELTSSLDNYSRSQVLETVRHVQRESGLALLFLSHDLAVMRAFCDEIAVLHEGRIVERQDPAGMFAAPRHPFTRRLVALTEQPLGSTEVLE